MLWQEGEGHSKRHLLVDTQGLVLKAKIHAANVFDRDDGIKPLMELLEERFARLLHLWLDAGYNGKGKGKDWAEKVLGMSVEVVRAPRRWVWVREDQEPPPRGRVSRSYRGDGWRRGHSRRSTRSAG